MATRILGEVALTMRRWFLVVLIGMFGWSGVPLSAADTDLPFDVIALSRISRNVKEGLSLLSDFTCLETTQRWSRASVTRDYKHLDTVQFEVAHIGKGELYSSPGARAFDANYPSDLSRFGTISSGGFAGYLHTVFTSGSTAIRFSGKETLNGREALRYDYTGSPLFDQFKITIAGRQGVASTVGRFWADAETLRLVRLEVHVASVPPQLPVSDLVTTIDYATVLLERTEAWMPQSVDLLLSYASGKQDNNRTVYTQCRQYVGEAHLGFGTDSSLNPPRAATEPRQFVQVQLPAGLNVPLQLETEIDSGRTLVGALVSATVSERLVARSGIVIPKGAIVRGRVRVLQREDLPVPHFLVGLEFVEMEFETTRAPFYARMIEPPRTPELQVLLIGRTTTRTRDYPAIRTETALWETARVPIVPGVSLFFMEGTAFRLPAGIRMSMRTIAPPLPE